MFDNGFYWARFDNGISDDSAGSNVTLREWTGKRLAVAQHFSPRATSGVSNTTQIIYHQRKVSKPEVV
jgi:hypothetical protein